MSTHPPWSILLIEKSKDLQSLIQMSLDLSIDATVHMVYSVSEAIELVHDILPDIILVGLENNGLESLQALSAQPILEAIPVIAITNRARRSDQLQIKKNGANAILQYPFEPIQFQKLLQEIC